MIRFCLDSPVMIQQIVNYSLPYLCNFVTKFRFLVHYIRQAEFSHLYTGNDVNEKSYLSNKYKRNYLEFL